MNGVIFIPKTLPSPTCSNCAYYSENCNKCLKLNYHISKKMTQKDRSMCKHYLYCMEDVDICEKKVQDSSPSNVVIHYADEWRKWRNLPL